MEKKALGRGLEALLPGGEDNNIVENQLVMDVSVEHVMPSRFQPRHDFSERELAELAESIRQTGMLQPVVVRRKGDGLYELVIGERRWRAAKMVGLSTIPAMIRNCSDDQATVLALVENLQRQDLNPMEMALAYQRMLSEFGMTQDDLARQIRKDRSSIANTARLLQLPAEVQRLVESGALSEGHAKVILGLDQPELQVRLAHRIVEGALSVREAEKLVEREHRAPKAGVRKAPRRAFPELEERIQKRLGTRVTIQKGRRGGKIVIDYFSQPELERILETLLA